MTEFHWLGHRFPISNAKTRVVMSVQTVSFFHQHKWFCINFVFIHMDLPDFGKLKSLHIHAWSKGLKTGMYYLRSRAAADVIKFIVDTSLLKIFLELMRVPRMEAKFNIFLFKIQFTSQFADLKKSLDVVNNTCAEVRKSTRLKEIMKRILYLGNTLNQGTARGQAVGSNGLGQKCIFVALNGDAFHSLRTNLDDPDSVLQSWDSALIDP